MTGARQARATDKVGNDRKVEPQKGKRSSKSLKKREHKVKGFVNSKKVTIQAGTRARSTEQAGTTRHKNETITRTKKVSKTRYNVNAAKPLELGRNDSPLRERSQKPANIELSTGATRTTYHWEHQQNIDCKQTGPRTSRLRHASSEQAPGSGWNFYLNFH